ncbi:MAG: NAD+ synthase [Alphaproteobacteria bacterium]|jgi:NAD+ synthase|nr:NAD+ synthase [Alphaproteobacteria bacterium]MBT5257101.1 NAD+ synthase [Alphaproteobacteria bacterium]MBT5729187.1 NAD+ synthase [Alphaproteobacteria bacterium]MBT7220560.1 NAD+ synthase [Alphaproteobacteria bacterium]MDA8881331.1 NAD+ synthase [Alphaproteobacteria bacterium]
MTPAETQKFGSSSMSVALAQLNPHLGDVSANCQKLLQMRERAAAKGADIILTPEMFLAGYPADDLVLRADFMDRIEAAISRLAKATADGGPAIIVGAPCRDKDVLYNSAFILDGGKIVARRDKVNLPNYGVFDDKRHFTPGQLQGPVLLRGMRLGIAVCEDIWFPDLCEMLGETGAEIILSLNASPFENAKTDMRMMHAVSRMTETGLPFVYVNMVGGQDELVFDGSSFALNLGGKIASQMPSFSEGLSLLEVRSQSGTCHLTGQISRPAAAEEDVWRALTLGVRDYVEKNGFPGVILGLSGGVDSAIVAVLAVDALGPERVRVVMMPSDYTADISLADAEELADNLGLTLETIALRAGMDAFDSMLEASLEGTEMDVTEENIQSRLRGMILMALSNKFGNMVLATGNKSEYAAGYSTLYGDMCGGFAPIKDVWKTEIFKLCEWRNTALPRGVLGPDGEVIPRRIITRPPSAELRPDQQDTDSLPPYDILDAILIALTEEMADTDTIVSRGYERETVERVSAMLFRTEYKRFQAAPGPKVTPRAFGRDRRLPLTSGFKPHLQD